MQNTKLNEHGDIHDQTAIMIRDSEAKMMFFLLFTLQFIYSSGFPGRWPRILKNTTEHATANSVKPKRILLYTVQVKCSLRVRPQKPRPASDHFNDTRSQSSLFPKVRGKVHENALSHLLAEASYTKKAIEIIFNVYTWTRSSNSTIPRRSDKKKKHKLKHIKVQKNVIYWDKNTICKFSFKHWTGKQQIQIRDLVFHLIFHPFHSLTKCCLSVVL